MELLPLFASNGELMNDKPRPLEFLPTDEFAPSRVPSVSNDPTRSLGSRIRPECWRSSVFDGGSPADSGPPSDIPVDLPTTSSAKHRGDPKKIRPEFCAVCGDAASGYHYEVPSCNGCKTFFRRTVLGQLKYFCHNKGQCAKKFNKRPRLHCRSCRYDLCVASGMNPLAMLADIHAAKNPVVKSILAKRQLQIAKVEERRENARNAKVIFHLTPSTENNVGRLVEKLLYLEAKADLFRRSSYYPVYHFLRLEEVLLGHSKFGQKYSEVDHHPVTFPLPCTDGAEHPRLPNATVSMKEDKGRSSDSPRQAITWRLMDSICVIEYLKTLEFFHRLSDTDKKVLVRGVTFPCKFLLSAFYSYSRNSDVMFFPDGTGLPFGSNTKKSCMSSSPHHSSMISHGLIRLLAASKLDRREYVLLKALVVCDQSLCDLSREAQQILSVERQKYAKSLFHYIMTHRGAKEGPKAYVDLMTMVGTLTRMDEAAKAVHLLVVMAGRIHVAHPLIDDICS